MGLLECSQSRLKEPRNRELRGSLKEWPKELRDSL